MFSLENELRKLFQNDRMRDNITDYEIFSGVVKDIDYENNLAIVDTPKGKGRSYFISNPDVNYYVDPISGQSSAYGIFGTVSKGSFVIGINLKKEKKQYILKSTPPVNGYPEFDNNFYRGLKRIPVAPTDPYNRDSNSTNIDNQDFLIEDTIKWGEYLILSSGFAQIFADYLGNIIEESSRQITTRIGDRDSSTNKILDATEEITINDGRIVDPTTGILKVDGTGSKVKKEYFLRNISTAPAAPKTILSSEVNGDGAYNITQYQADGITVKNSIAVDKNGALTITTPNNASINLDSSGNVTASSNSNNSKIILHANGQIEVLGGSSNITVNTSGQVNVGAGASTVMLGGNSAPHLCNDLPNCLFTGSPHALLNTQVKV